MTDKEFWEGCGLKVGIDDIDGTFFRTDDLSYTSLPLDLNNLFLYAVPRAIDKIMAEQCCSSDLAYAILFKKWLQKLELDIPNHAGTLRQAIWEVIKR